MILGGHANRMPGNMAKKNPKPTFNKVPAKAPSPALDPFRAESRDSVMTSNQGVQIIDDENSLKAGVRGPTLLEDHFMREKITHFDHERIPERVVHARGAAAHGYFQVYKSQSHLTKAGFLNDPKRKTPVFVRFSTVAGSRGSADTARDVRGFAVKFYTDEGNYDLVGNNIPVFFIQDAIKFPDLIHAAKPEPQNEIPQASTAHDTLWDFISMTPESTHMAMWIMSDRAIPRSLRMMEGFGVHTFRLVDAKGVARFVKFHWKPVLGSHALIWDEAQKIAGKDPDFHRRDLWEAIETGQYPEWELGLQVIEEKDEHRFDFDLLDPTKLIPEELVPVQIVGKMTLNRNPDNYFSETEQVAFCASHVVPGIDFSNDPLLQGRLFSYLDTQISRLGGPNFHELPINRPVCPFSNNQRDGIHRQTIDVGNTSYHINSIADDSPREASPEEGFSSYPEKMSGNKIRERSPSFADHYSQATLFWNSQSETEKKHIVSAFTFELSKVESPAIRERMVGRLLNVDKKLGNEVATNIGLTNVKPVGQLLKTKGERVTHSQALSMLKTTPGDIRTRKIAILAADGVNGAALSQVKAAIEAAGGMAKVVSPRVGTIKTSDGKAIPVDFSIDSMPSVLFDAVYVPDGKESVTQLLKMGSAVHYILESYKHCKAIAASGEGERLIPRELLGHQGVISAGQKPSWNEFSKRFISAVSEHRAWNRIDVDAIAA
jgi:catalase